MLAMNELFIKRTQEYFKDEADRFRELLAEPETTALFLNQKKAAKQDILELIDFPITQSQYSDDCFYYECDSIGKSRPYELGLIYPQDVAASLTTKYLINKKIRLAVDMCSAPGGKTINALNRLDDDVLFIANDISHKRALTLSSNLERLGLANVIVTNKKTDMLAKQLSGCADLVILDAPCSGEGMIRRYPQILEDYSLNNIEKLANIQKKLLEEAYEMLNEGGQLVYSTCTYSFEEDEWQIIDFLKRHKDMHLLPLNIISPSSLNGTIKLSPLNNTEGQFIALLEKDGEHSEKKLKYLKPVQDKLVKDFISDNLSIEDYYLYFYNDHYYLSLIPLIDLGSNILKYGICLGEKINKRFEANHCLYRANPLKNAFRYSYDLNDKEYDLYISGNELPVDLDDHLYQITYHKHSLGYGKCLNRRLKNKYPKGLRRMI